MKTEELVEKILKEQDLLCFYAVNNDDVLFDDYIKEDKLGYREACKLYFENEQTLEKVSTENLLRLLIGFRTH